MGSGRILQRLHSFYQGLLVEYRDMGNTPGGILEEKYISLKPATDDRQTVCAMVTEYARGAASAARPTLKVPSPNDVDIRSDHSASGW